MSSKNTLQVSLDLVLGNASSTIKNVQGLLDSLNISKLDGQFNKNFSSNMSKQLTALQTESEKLKTSLETSLNGKVDEKGISSSITKMISLYGQLENEVTKIASLPQVDMEKLIKLNPSLAGEITNIEAKVKELQNSIKQQSKAGLTTALQELSQAGQSFTKGSSPDKHVKELSQQLQSGQINITQYAQSLQELQAKYAAYIETSKKAAQNAGTEWDKSGNIRKNAQAFETLATAVQKSVEPIERVQQEVNSLESDKARKLGQAYEEVSTKAQNAEQGVKEASQSVKEYGTNATSAAHAQNEFISELDEVKSRVKYFFSLTNSIQLFKNAIRDAFETVKELDAAMTETAVVTDFSVGDMWDALPQYTKLAESLGATTLGAYETMTLYYQQGLKTNEAMQLGTETMKMARIAGMDYATATNLMTSALRGFNMELNTTSAQKVNDVYSELAAITASDTEGIATAMSKTASIANSANMELETTSALLSQIIETTQEAPETAGTAMKTIIARFSEVKKLYNQGSFTGVDGDGEAIEVNKVAAALKTAGINMNKFFSGSVGLDDIFLELAEKWDSLDITQQRYIATQAAGSRQQSRFIAMMSDYDRTMELVNAAYNSGGASAEQFAKTQDSLQSKLNKLSDEWERFTMGLANSTVIKGAVDLLTNLLSTINNLTECFDGGKGIISGILKFTAALGAIKLGKTLLNGGLTGVIGSLSNSFNKMDTSGIANAGDRAGMTFGRSFTTSISRSLETNPIFGKNSKLGRMGDSVNDWYGKQVKKFNIGHTLKEELGVGDQKDISALNPYDLSSTLENTYRNATLKKGSVTKALTGNLKKQLAPQIQKGLQELNSGIFENVKVPYSDELGNKIGDGLAKGISNGKVTEGIDNAMMEVQSHIEQSLTQMGAGEGVSQIAQEATQQIFSGIQVNGEEVANTVGPALTDRFDMIAGGLSNIGAISTTAAIGLGLVANKMRECGNEDGAESLEQMSSVLMMVGVGAQFAGQCMQIFAAGGMAALGSMLPVLLAIAAVIGVIALTIKMVEIDNYDPLEDKINQLKEATLSASEAAEEAKTAYEDLGEASSSYKNLKRELDGLTKGTIAYSDKLLEANMAASELIKNHDLSFNVDENGLIVIDENELETQMKKSLKNSTKALNISLGLEQNEKVAEEQMDRREKNEDINKGIRPANDGYSLTLQKFNDYVEHKITATRQYDEYTAAADTIEDANQYQKFISALVEKDLIDQYGIVGDAMEEITQLAKDFYGEDIAATISIIVSENADKMYNYFKNSANIIGVDVAEMELRSEAKEKASLAISDSEIITKDGTKEGVAAALSANTKFYSQVKQQAEEQANNVADDSERLAERYAALYDNLEAAGEKIYDKETGKEVEVSEDVMKNVINENILQEAIKKAGEEISSIVKQINERQSKNSGVDDTISALAEGDTSVETKFLEKIIAGEGSSDLVANALGISSSQFDQMAKAQNLTSQELRDTYVQQAKAISDAQATMVDNLFYQMNGIFSTDFGDSWAKIEANFNEKKQNFTDSLNSLSMSQKTFFSDAAFSIRKSFGTDTSANFLDSTIGSEVFQKMEETDRKAYAEKIQQAFEDIDFSNPISALTQLNDAELNAANTLQSLGVDLDNLDGTGSLNATGEAAKAVYQNVQEMRQSFSGADAFKALYSSNEWKDVQKEIDKTLDKKTLGNKTLNGSDVKALANEFSSLATVMEEGKMSATGMAEVINSLGANGSLTLQDLDANLWDLISTSHQLESAIDDALDFTANFDPGIDEGEVDDWYKSTLDTVNELWNNGEYGNTQLYNYLNSMFSDFAENVTKEGLKEAERKALDKLNAYQYKSFQTSWLDIARNSTGDYSSKMAEKGWKVTANSDDSIDLVSTGEKNTTNDLIDSIQYSYGVTEDMAKMMVTSLKNSDAEFAQMMEKNDFVAGIDKYINNLKQTIKGQEESIVFSDLQVEKIAATTGQTSIEVWKEFAKSVGVSTEGLETEEAIKKKLSETTDIYVANLKTAADRQKELNKLFGNGEDSATEEGGESSGFKKGDNWLSSFANGNTIDIGRIKTSLSKMGLNEDQIYETIQEGLEHFNNGGDYNWEINGKDLDFDKLKEDVKSTVQEGLDNLDSTKLTNTITNGVVQGFLEAQEVINSKINGQDWTTKDYQHYTKLKNQGANITPSDYASLASEYKNKFGDNFVNAKIVVDDNGVVRVEQSLEKIKQNIATLGNESIQVNVEKKSLTELNKLSTTVVTLGNKDVEVYIEEEDGSVTKLYNSVGELVGILDETGKSYEVKISDDGKSRELYDSTGKYLGVLELTNGTWTSHVNNTLTQSDQNKIQRYLDSLGTIPSEITTTIKTVYVETSMKNAELQGFTHRSDTVVWGSPECKKIEKEHPNAVWRYTVGTTSGVWMWASGTTRSGVPKTQNALVGEEGPELVETNDGKAHLVGVHGPEISKLKKGDIVHNASDTERILKGKPTKPLKAYKNGTPNGRTTFSAYSGYSKPSKTYGNSSSSSSSSSSGNSGSSSSSESPYQKWKGVYDTQLSNDVISIDWYINRLNNMAKTISMTKEEQYELNKAIRDARYDKASALADQGALTYQQYANQLEAIYSSYPKKGVEGAKKLRQEIRDLWKDYADSSYDLGTFSPEWYLQVLQKQQSWYTKGSKVWRDYEATIISVKNELLDMKFNSGEIGMWSYIESLKELQKQYTATSKQARELSKTIREQKIAYAEASQKHGLWSIDYEITYLKENLADMKEGTEEYRDALDQIRELQLSNAENKYNRGQWSYERYMQFLKDYQAENQFPTTTEQYQEIMSKQTELEIEHINELLDKYNQLNNQLGDIDTGRERAQEIININNELADTHDRLVDIKYALDNQVLTEAQRKAFEEEYNELLVRQVQLLDKAKSKQEEYTDIMKEGLEAQKKLMSDGWGTDDPRKAAQLGLMSVQYAENDRYLAQQQKKTAMNNMQAALIEPQVTLTQKYVSEVNAKKANGEYVDDLAYTNALAEAMAKGLMNAPTNVLPYARVDETSGMVTINQTALDTLKVTNPEEYRKVSEVITIMQGYSEDWMEGNIAEVEATELLEELTDNQKYIDLINRVADDLKQIDQNAIDELEDQKDALDDITDSVASIIEKVREAIDKIRQERDNENTRQDLMDKQQKLAYLRQDSTGNALEIKQLEKELADDSQSYTDTLIDQKINELEEQNEETQDELQELIDLKKEEMKRKEKEGTYYEQAQKVVDEFIANDLDDVAANTKDIRDTYLGQIIKEGEKLDTSMSKPEQEKTWTEVKKEAEDAGVSKELHDTAEKANLTKETASEVAKSFGETTKDIAQATGKIASAFAPALDYAINGIADAIKKDKENKSYTDDALKGQETAKPSGAASSSGDKKDNTTTTPATPAPTPTPSKPATSTTTTPASTQGDGKIQKGDNVTFVKGKYFNDSYGTAPTGYWHLGEKNAVYVTLINTDKNASHPYHISTGKKLGIGDLGWVKKDQLQGYKTGGMVDFTGPAWLDGTRSKPESVLSAADTQNLLNLTDVLGNLRKNTAKGTTQTNISNDINIEIKVDRVDSDIDINKLADTIGDKVKKSIYKDTKGFQNTRLTHR